MHKDPITARETIRQDEADEIMKIKKLECLPLVDENGILKAILKPDYHWMRSQDLGQL